METPLPLRPRLPPDAVEKLDQLWTAIVQPQSEVEVSSEAGEISSIAPYWTLCFVAIESFESPSFENLQLRA